MEPTMSKSKPPPRQNHGDDLADDIDTALESITVALGHANESVHDYAADVLVSFDHPEPGSKPSAKHALRTIGAHPFATVASIATIVSALVGMALVRSRTKAHSRS